MSIFNRVWIRVRSVFQRKTKTPGAPTIVPIAPGVQLVIKIRRQKSSIQKIVPKREQRSVTPLIENAQNPADCEMDSDFQMVHMADSKEHAVYNDDSGSDFTKIDV